MKAATTTEEVDTAKEEGLGALAAVEVESKESEPAYTIIGMNIIKAKYIDSHRYFI